MRIARVLRTHHGLTLAETTTGEYLVGICYTADLEITQLRPEVDLLVTKSLPVAEHFYHLHTGEKT